MVETDQRGAFALEVVETLADAGFDAVWAGGCVRDLLLGRTPGDYDVATDAHPDRVRDVFGRSRTQTVGAAFGVVLVHGDRDQAPIEVATFRTEGAYHDGRHPEVVQFVTRAEDARRRDFTINGMFMDPRTGEVFDDVGGREDLEKQVVSAIGDPESRFDEDKLRMLRAIRFTASLSFSLDPATAQAIAAHADEISVVSAERLADEWRRMLGECHRGQAVRLAAETTLLEKSFPEISAGGEDEAVRRVDALPAEAGFPLALAALLLDVPDSRQTCERLKLSNRETDEVAWLVASQNGLAGAAGQRQSRLFPLLSHRCADQLLDLVEAVSRSVGEVSEDVVWCRDLLGRVTREELDPPELLSGDDLIADGLSPGPLFKTLLDSLRAAQLDGEVQSR
ncbi:MAG: CCA tRNA nucleotidyltransferase, partial [Planctomycetaceae bacterium]